jgi:protein SSD1
MTDEVTPQTQTSALKKDERIQQGGNGQKGPKKTMSRSASSGGNGTGPPRPSSGASNKRVPSNPPGGNDSGAESRKGNNDNKKADRGGRPQGNGRGGGGNRKSSQSSRPGAQGNRESISRQNSNKQSSGSPAPVPPTTEGTDALSAIQRAIADLKTTTPGQNAPAITASQSGSYLPPNAPVFQPGATAYPGIAGSEAPRHRKAASLGAGSLSNNHFNNFAPGLGAMMEDVIEEGPGAHSFEDGEIPDTGFQPGPQRRSLSQSFTAPRFAALAAQQEQPETVGPTGRPQLAPGFMFGARRRPSSHMPMGPPISEEDVGFQFPQQHQMQQLDFGLNAPPEPTHRKTESQGEISGIMAEQV